MKITHYASGSAANAIQVDNVLIDAGVKVDAEYDTLLITHSHIDHIRHLKHALMGCKRFYTTDRVLASIKDKMQKWGEKSRNETLGLIENKYAKPDNIETFDLKHDVPCVGFVVYGEYVHMSDTGVLDPLPEIAKNKTFLTIESNYDLYELKTSGRPLELIERIQKTHMSNEQAIELAKQLNPKHAMFVHFSTETNSVDLAKATHGLQEVPFKTYYPKEKMEILV